MQPTQRLLPLKHLEMDLFFDEHGNSSRFEVILSALHNVLATKPSHINANQSYLLLPEPVIALISAATVHFEQREHGACPVWAMSEQRPLQTAQTWHVTVRRTTSGSFEAV